MIKLYVNNLLYKSNEFQSVTIYEEMEYYHINWYLRVILEVI